MRTASIMPPRRSAMAIGLLSALGVFVLSGCTTPMGSADNKRNPFADWFGTSRTDSTAQAEAASNATRPKNPMTISKETRDQMKRLNAELRRHKMSAAQRDEVLRRLLRNQPKDVVDALSKVR